MGINAPRAHQRIIARLTSGLCALFYSGTIPLEPLPETMIDESQSSPVPDIILADDEHDTVPIIIEVAHGAGVQNDIEKVRKLIATTHYGIKEGFVYDYKKNRWYRIHHDLPESTDISSISSILHLDFSSLL